MHGETVKHKLHLKLLNMYHKRIHS